jgi:chromosome segregation ATPase
MKTNELKNATEKSFGIFKRRSEGVAGPSREVSKRDASASGADEAGQENTHDENVQTGVTVQQQVKRAHGFCGQSTGQERASKSAIRKRTRRDLQSPDTGEAYIELEDDIRKFFSSLMEQQNQMYNSMICKVRDLECQIKDLGHAIGDDERRIKDLECTIEDPGYRINDFGNFIDEIEDQFNDIGCLIAVSEIRIKDLEHTLGVPERQIDELIYPIEDLTCWINDLKHSMESSERRINNLKLCTESPTTEQSGIEKEAWE